jgi:hypothetical protein
LTGKVIDRRGLFRPAVLLALLCVAASLVSLSCGSKAPQKTESATTTDVPGTRRLVTDNEIDQAEPRSPQRALLAFFQAVQFNDARGARELISTRINRAVAYKRLRGIVDLVGGALGKPDIQSVRRRGNTAFARVLVLAYVPGKPTAVSGSPATFILRLQGRDWKIDNLDYLFATANAIALARKKSG